MSGPDGSPYLNAALATPGGFLADSVTSGLSTTSPGIGAALAQIPAVSLPSGIYKVDMQILISGTYAQLDLTNCKITKNAATLVGLLVAGAGVVTTTTLLPTWITLPRVTMDGVSTLNIRSTAAGTIGSVYSCLLVATQIG